ncbi:MAG TPA: hypothetical protein PLJ38_03505, partial [bacterium]|nr:hypothetical protein [bacterium]
MKNKIFIYAFFSFAILYFCYRGIIYPALNNNDDFGVYYHTALKISNFDLDIYNTKIHTDVFNYPPIFALMLKPIIFFDYQTSKII